MIVLDTKALPKSILDAIEEHLKRTFASVRLKGCEYEVKVRVKT